MPLDTDDGDWIPLFRKIRRNWIWADPSDLRAWVDLLMLANHHDGVFRFRGHIHPMKRGQVATTYASLAKRNGWGRGRVKRFLNRLAVDEMIVVFNRNMDTKTDTWMDSKADTGFLLVTIVNYPVMRGGSQNQTADQTADQTGNRPGTGQGPARDRPGTGHIQEGREGKERKKGGEGRASASALPTPAAAPPGLRPPAKSRQEVVADLLAMVEVMSPAAARKSVEFDESMYDGNHPYPEVFEAKKKKASMNGEKTV